MKPISLQRNSDVKHEIFQPDERVSAISGRKIHCQARRDPLPRRIRCLALREPNKTWQRVLKCGGKQVYIRPHVRVDFQDVHRGGLHLRPRPFHSPVIGKMSNRLQRKHGVPTTRVSSSFSWSSLPRIYRGFLLVTSKTLRKSVRQTRSTFVRPPVLPSHKHISLPSTIKPESCPFFDGLQNWGTNSTAYQRVTVHSFTA